MMKSELNRQRQGNSLNTVLIYCCTRFREVLTFYDQDLRKGSKLYGFQLLQVMSLLPRTAIFVKITIFWDVV